MAQQTKRRRSPLLRRDDERDHVLVFRQAGDEFPQVVLAENVGRHTDAVDAAGARSLDQRCLVLIEEPGEVAGARRRIEAHQRKGALRAAGGGGSFVARRRLEAGVTLLEEYAGEMPRLDHDGYRRSGARPSQRARREALDQPGQPAAEIESGGALRRLLLLALDGGEQALRGPRRRRSERLVEVDGFHHFLADEFEPARKLR